MSEYIHDFDLMFSVRSDSDDPDDIPPGDLLTAALNRLNSLKEDEFREAFGHCGGFEETQHRRLRNYQQCIHDVWYIRVSHRHGHNLYLGASEEEVMAELQTYVNDNIDDYVKSGNAPPDDFVDVKDYFEVVEDESFEVGHQGVTFPEDQQPERENMNIRNAGQVREETDEHLQKVINEATEELLCLAAEAIAEMSQRGEYRVTVKYSELAVSGITVSDPSILAVITNNAAVRLRDCDYAVMINRSSEGLGLKISWEKAQYPPRLA